MPNTSAACGRPRASQAELSSTKLAPLVVATAGFLVMLGVRGEVCGHEKSGPFRMATSAKLMLNRDKK